MFCLFGLFATQDEDPIPNTELHITRWFQKHIGFIIILNLLSSVQTYRDHLLIKHQGIIEFAKCLFLILWWY